MRKNKTLLTVLAIITAAALALTGCSGSKKSESGTGTDSAKIGDPVKVGWTHHTEDAIMGHMIAILLREKLGLTVETAPNLGGTGIAHDAIIAGEIDIYPDYTGDALANVLKMDPIPDPQQAYEAVKQGYLEKYDITWLAPTPFNNTYALAVKKSVAEQLNLSTISDLKEHAPEWIISSSVEFASRELDGYPGMAKFYGFEFKEIKPMDPGLMYTAIHGGDVDVIVAFATDARIGKFELTVLEDDKKFFPSYNAAPTIRNEVLNAHPEIEQTLNEVFSSLDTETMIALNGKVDMDNQNPEEVAREFLKEKGFI